ncbi:MAG TPA: hypothetical protein VGW10_13070, partial [Solirubrobacteraceae bacterium]|nr:hypothetical protein [Solirubrobacteraceae bacterium]
MILALSATAIVIVVLLWEVLMPHVDEYLDRRRAKAAPAAAATRQRTGDTRAAKKELVRIERAMEKFERRATKLHAELAAK